MIDGGGPIALRDLLRLGGALAALGWALIHLAIAPEHYTEEPYIGVAFVVGAGLLLAAATSIAVCDFRLAWQLGAVVAAGATVALLCSRTVGLPGGYREGWEPAAWASLGLAAAFLCCYLARMWVGEHGARR